MNIRDQLMRSTYNGLLDSVEDRLKKGLLDSMEDCLKEELTWHGVEPSPGEIQNRLSAVKTYGSQWEHYWLDYGQHTAKLIMSVGRMRMITIESVVHMDVEIKTYRNG